MNHKITLIGAKTDISGIFHGPIYYYIAAIPFALSHGNPIVVSYFLIILNCLTVFLIYSLAKILFNRRVGLISSLLFCASFLASIYPRWLSTHPLSILFSTCYFFLLSRFLKGDKKSLPFAAILFGLLTQSEFLNILFMSVVTFLLIVIYRKNFQKINPFYLFGCFILSVLISIGPFVFFDLRHQFLISKNILALFTGSSSYHISLIYSIQAGLQAFSSLLSSVIFPPSSIIALVLFIASLFYTIRKSDRQNQLIWILPIWLFVPFLLIIALRHGVQAQYFVALIPPLIIYISYLIDAIWNYKPIAAYLLLVCIVLCNFIVFFMDIPQNKNVFYQTTQPDLKYSDELQVINLIYTQADHNPFSVQAYTIPYWSQEGWQYLFWSYGLRKYGYFPVDQKAKLLFVIIQNDPSNTHFQKAWLRNNVSKWGKLQKTFTFGALKVEELYVSY